MCDLALQAQLRRAIESADVEELEVLISAGADVNHKANDPDAETPLIWAITAGRSIVVRLLIQSGADINYSSKLSGWTPLMYALDKPTILRELIHAGADVNARTVLCEIDSPRSGHRIRRGGDTALHLAAATNNTEAIQILVKAGAAIEAIDASGRTPLDVALRVGSPTDAVVALVDAGAELTDERMEAMHSGAHHADSTLRFFPSVDELAVGQPGRVQDRTPASSPAQSSSPAQPSCPSCGALIYSRKARLCGACGKALSPELRLGDNQERLINEQRKWAHGLADALGSALGGTPGVGSPAAKVSVDSSARSPLDLVRNMSCAEEFKRRRRPGFWLYVLGYGLMLAVLVPIFAIGPVKVPPVAYLVAICLLLFALYRAWQRAAPVCPGCGKNIQRCDASYCHTCGKELRARRCSDCTPSRASPRLPFGDAASPSRGRKRVSSYERIVSARPTSWTVCTTKYTSHPGGQLYTEALPLPAAYGKAGEP